MPRKTERFTEAYKRWRLSVFQRDKFKCQMPGCVSTSRKIHAHHIKRWVDCPSLRHNVNNGITLCWSCHTKTLNHEHEYEARLMMIVASKSNGAVDAMLMKYYRPPGENCE